MLRVLAVLLYLSAGSATLAVYDVPSRLERLGSHDNLGPLVLSMMLWPSFPIVDALGRIGAR